MYLMEIRVAAVVANLERAEEVAELRLKLLDARACMEKALAILDICSPSFAAANLDLAIYHLNRELAAP